MGALITGPGYFRNFSYLPAFKRHYPDAFLQLSRKYGSVYRIHLPFRAIFAGDPRLIAYVLKKNAKNYIKGKLYEPLKPILGNGLVTSEGEEWKKNRRTIAPEFHSKSIEGYVDVMVRHALDLASRWSADLEKNSGTFNLDLSAAMMDLTLSIVGETFFGDSLGSKSAEIADNLYILLDHSVKKTMQFIPIPDSVPTMQNRRARIAANKLDSLVRELIQKRKSGLNRDRQDVLSRLLLAKDKETGEGISDSQLLDEVKTMMLAGHETTSLALTWCWYLLALNPQAEKKLHTELDTILQGRAPTLNDFEKLPYTRQVILETLRLYPPIPVISRQAIEDDSFEGLQIPKGSIVQLAPYVVHRDPKFWVSPDDFIPERFENERPQTNGLIYFPFAAGPRACIGEHFAMTEAIMILATLAGKFRFRLSAPDTIIESEALNTLRPRGGMRVLVEKR